MGVLRQKLTQSICVEHGDDFVVLNFALQDEMPGMYVFFFPQAHCRNVCSSLPHATREYFDECVSVSMQCKKIHGDRNQQKANVEDWLDSTNSEGWG